MQTIFSRQIESHLTMLMDTNVVPILTEMSAKNDTESRTYHHKFDQLTALSQNLNVHAHRLHHEMNSMQIQYEDTEARLVRLQRHCFMGFAIQGICLFGLFTYNLFSHRRRLK